MPAELAIAQQLELLCQRYHCTPVEAFALPAWVLRHISILAEAGWGQGDG